MAEVVSKIKLDVAKNNIMDFVLAKQGDKASRFLEIELQNNGEKIEVLQTSKVYLNAEKPDKTITKTSGKVLENGKLRVGLTNQTLACDGQVICDVSVENEDSVLTSLKFNIKVEACTAGDDVVVSTDEFTVLDEMVIRVDELETTVTSNEADRIENETARQEAEVERIAENKKVEELINGFVGTIPMATSTTPGAVKSGGDIEIKSPGVVTVPGLDDKADAENVYDKKNIDDKFDSLFLCGEVNTITFDDGGDSPALALRYYKKITFAKPFPAVPKIILSQVVASAGAGSVAFVAINVTKTSFEIRSDYSTSEITLNWLAIQ